jgi:NADPH2:quinone reductase
MKAWLLPALTGVASMTLGETEDPVAGPGEVVLEVQYAALNPADNYLSLGQYAAKPAFPHILGRDGVGIVHSVGAGVSDVHVGDTRVLLRSEVGVNRRGTLAQRVAVEAAYTVGVPNGWSLQQAAAAPLVYVTSWQAIDQWNDLPANPVTLISGASGGVGVACTQLAHAMGHTVIALSRSPEKGEKLKALGATMVYDPTDPDWRKKCKERFPGRVQLAIDNIGGEGFNHILEVMAERGRISSIGRLAGPVPSFNTAALYSRRLRIGGVFIAAYTNEEAQAAWRGVLQTLAKTGAKPLIDHVFKLEEVPVAFARLKEGPMGKVLIQITT